MHYGADTPIQLHYLWFAFLYPYWGRFPFQLRWKSRVLCPGTSGLNAVYPCEEYMKHSTRTSECSPLLSVDSNLGPTHFRVKRLTVAFISHRTSALANPFPEHLQEGLGEILVIQFLCEGSLPQRPGWVVRSLQHEHGWEDDPWAASRGLCEWSCKRPLIYLFSKADRNLLKVKKKCFALSSC